MASSGLFADMAGRWSLRTLLAVQISMLLLAPLLVAIVLVAVWLMPTLAEDARENKVQAARLLATQIETILAERSEQIRILAAIIDQSRFDNRVVLQEFASATGAFEAVYILDDQGLVREVGLPHYSQQLYANILGLDLSRFSFAPDDPQSGHWSVTFLSTISGQLAVAYSVATQGGVLVGEIRISDLPAMVRTSGESGQVLMVLDSNHQLIAHTDETLSGQQINLSNLALVQLEPGEPVVAGRFQFNRQSWFGARVSTSVSDWSVIVAEPLARAFQQQALVNRILQVTLIVALATVLLGAAWGSMRLGRWFQGYAGVVQRLAEGDYQLDLGSRRIRELDDLNQHLRQTATAIREREARLTQLNQELDLRVQERTAKLSDTNAQLKTALDELRLAQQDLVQAEKLAALGGLVAGLSHELNTPLGIGVTTLSTMQAQLQAFEGQFNQGQLTKTELQQFLDNCRTGTRVTLRNIEKAADLISSFKQVAVDQTSNQRRCFELHQLVDDVLLTLKPMLRQQAIELQVMVPRGVELDSYPGPLGQVLTNLVSNAVVHGLAGQDAGWIRIEVRADEGITLAVSDSGAGIPDEYLKRVFEPFFTTRRGRGGSGLGLHIVHTLVTQVLAGSIHVENGTVGGARFTVVLPRQAP
ncbi:MAG: hypothetical protein LAT63_12320 [Marinobacter sp.]|nr:hypothetical protein [Marinobacter sp.]